MSGAVWFLVGTLALWAGWIAIARAALLGVQLAMAYDPERRQGRAKGVWVALAVGAALLAVAQGLPIDPGRPAPEAPIRIPLVWVLMPFTAWLALASLAMVVVRVIHAVSALNRQEARQKLGAAAVWLLVGIGSFWLFQRSGDEAVVFRGVLPLSYTGAFALAALFVATAALMVVTARSHRLRGLGKGVATHTALVLGSVLFGIPFVWLLVTSFKESRDMVSADGIRWIPRVWVTVPYDDPIDPLFEVRLDDGRVVQANIAEKLPNGRVILEVYRPFSQQGLRVERSMDEIRRVPKDCQVVTATLEGRKVKAFIAQNLMDGRQRLRVLEPKELAGREFLAQPSETEPYMVTGLRLQNYSDALQFLPPEANYGLTYLKNTLILVVMGLVGTLLSSALVAYGFARLRWPGKGPLFTVMLSTMMLPGAVTLLPSFLIFRSLGWIDTLYPMWVPAFFASAFNVFLLRQFFLNIPMELEDAAKIDGCSYLRTFWQVMLPQVKPALAVIAIWTFMGAWNNFMGPLIYVSSPENMPIAYAVQLFQSDRGGEPGLIMAFATMAMLPVLLVFFLAQKYFIEGVQLTGLGGR